MIPTTKRFAWHDRDTAARDLLQLAYYAPGAMSRNALELIWIIGSSSKIVWALEDIVLDINRPLIERRYALWAIAAAPYDFYFPRLARFTTLKPDSDWLDLNFYDVARLAQHHPSNHEWLFRKFEAKGPETYLEALEIATRCEHNETLNPLLLQRLIVYLNQHPSMLSSILVDRLALHGGYVGKWWLLDHLDQVIGLYHRGEELDTFFYVLERVQSPELTGEVISKHPLVAQILSQRGEERRERERLKKIKAANAPYLQSATWKKLHGLYNRAKQEPSAAWCLRDIAMDSYRTVPAVVRVAAIFFLSDLKHQYPVLLRFLCSLVKQYDGCVREYSAPIREEALIALSDAPTAEVWEALIEGYFYNRTNYLDWIYPPTIRRITDALENGNRFAFFPPYNQTNMDRFNQLATIDFDLPDTCL